MSTLFDRLAARAVGGQNLLAPRRPHRFEGPGGAADTALPEFPRKPGERGGEGGVEQALPSGGAGVRGGEDVARAEAPTAARRRQVIEGLEPYSDGGGSPKPRRRHAADGPTEKPFGAPTPSDLGAPNPLAMRPAGEERGTASPAPAAGAGDAGFGARGLEPLAARRPPGRDQGGRSGGEDPVASARAEATAVKAAQAAAPSSEPMPFAEEADPELTPSSLRPATTRRPESRGGSAPALGPRTGAATETPPAETVVRVTIGTVVVRAAAEPPTEARRPGLAQPQTTLAQYLERRRGGGP
jgi:hypothetical protein